MKKTVTGFIDWQKNEANYSENTIRAYKRHILQFIAFFEGIDGDSLSDVNNTIIGQFFSISEVKALKRSSMLALSAALDTYFEYLYLESIVEHNPIKRFKSKQKLKGRGGKSYSRKPAVLLETEIGDLLYAIENDGRKIAQRNLVLVSFLIDTGVRTSEVSNVTVSDIKSLLSDGVIRVIGKGNKERVLKPDISNRASLQKFYDLRVGLGTDCAFFFISRTHEKLGQSGIYKMVNGYLSQAGINKPQNGGHLLRHTAASLMLKKTENIRAVQAALGHESITTTEAYAHLI